jgi:hypothetical protein
VYHSPIVMASAAPVAGPLLRAGARDGFRAAAVALLAAAVLLRFGQFGNALAGLDEQFYLLVGERMWAGELPYVDLWDRKPLGLFILFAGIARLPIDGVVAAQLVATAFAAATAILVTLIARRRVGWTPAVLSGVFYLAGVNQLWGETTQTPVFYNALVAGSALLTLQAADRDDRRLACWAMALCGVAIQIKTNAVFQGGFFGLWLLVAAWRPGESRGSIGMTAALFAVLGALPTLLAFAAYAAMGHADAWWQANVLSIIAKGAPHEAIAFRSFWESAILFAPAGLLALLGLRARTERFTRVDRETGFLIGWGAVGLVDFLAIGGFYPHYAIPLLLAVCPLIASAFAHPRAGIACAVLSLAWPAYHAAVINPSIAAKEMGYAGEVLARVPGDVRTRCLFIYEGPVAYYRLTQACRVSRYAFTAHLSSFREAPSLGVDPAAEIARIMARRPGVVMTVEHSAWPDRNPAMERLMARELKAHYRPAARVPHHSYAPGERLLIWRVRPGSQRKL